MIKTKGIVIHNTKYSETSLIVKIYTEELGLVSYLVNGVRTNKSKAKAAMLQPLSMLDLVVYHSEQKNLQRIKEFKRSSIFESIPFNIIKSSVALFIAELLHKSIKEEEENRMLFAFLTDSLLTLDTNEKVSPIFHLSFMLKLSAHIGFMPLGRYTANQNIFDLQQAEYTQAIPPHSFHIAEPESKYFDLLLHTSYIEQQSLSISKESRKFLLRAIENYFKLHLDNFRELQSPKVLEAIF